MAKIKQNLVHSLTDCEKLNLVIPDGVSRNNLRCHEAGDKFAESLFESKGYYDKLSKSFNKISSYCEKALNNSAFTSTGTKKYLNSTIKKCSAQAVSCSKRASEMKISYNLTADIVSSMDN